MVNILKNLAVKDVRRVDLSKYFLKDLFEIRHPHLYKKPSEKEFKQFEKDYLKDKNFVWAYYSDEKIAYKIPNENDFYEVLTSRNKPYVSQEEQENFYNYKVGVVGLSVGQSSVFSIVRSGGAKNLKIADFDITDPSNLNRLHFGIDSIGKPKVDELEKRILKINPFLNVQKFSDGFTEKNANDFFNKNFKLDVIIDACDFFPAKIMIRQLAQKYKIPVLMATDTGDGALIDIERYDLNEKTVPFGGRLDLTKKPDDFLKAAITLISPEHIPFTLQDRFFEIGKTTPTHPQLANSAYFAGTAISYLVRMLANKREIVDDRVYIDYDELFDPKYKDENFKKIKKEKLDAFKKALGLN